MKTIHTPMTLIATLFTSSPVATPAAATSNDNATPKRIPRDTNALLAHPEVVRAIEGTLMRHGVARQDLADGVAQVQMRALEATANKACPTDIGSWKALSCTIAERMAMKDRGRERRRGRYNDGLCEAPDDHGPIEGSPSRPDAIDLRRQLEVLRGQLDAGDMPDHGEAIIEGVGNGLSAREIGAELGISESMVRNRLSRIRKLFTFKLASLGLLLLTLMVAVLFSAPLGGLADREVAPTPSLPPTTVARTITPQDRAADLRDEALDACSTQQWDRCLGRLDEAAKLDPAGDDAPDVQVARARAERALDDSERRLEAKPRP